MDRSFNTPTVRQSSSTSITVKDILSLLLRNWYWFLLCMVIALGLGFLKVKKTPPLYQRTASILIKSNDQGSTDQTLRELGVAQTPANLVNEMLMMNTSIIASEIVSRLDLDVGYFQHGYFYDKTVYGVNLPIKVKFMELNDRESASLHVDLAADGAVSLSGMKRGGEEFGQKLSMHLGDTVQSPMGKLAVLASPYYSEGSSCSLDVLRYNLSSIASNVRSHIYAGLRDQNSTIVDIHFRDVSPSRAEDILSTLVAVYNENWMQDRNKRIISTNEFIKERLGVIEEELGDVDKSISSFKSEHLILDIDQAGSIAYAQANESEQQSTALENRIYMLRSVKDYLTGSQGDIQQIPYTSGINNPLIEQRILAYNELLLQRNNHLANSSAQNPLVQDLNKQLGTMKESIVQDLDTEIATLRLQQRNILSVRGQAVSRVASNPQQANYLLSVERQQKVKESLYLFLLQKREENELSQAFTAYNTQLIEPPHGSMNPVQPVARNIYLLAFILGLAVPAVILAIKELLKTTVQDREDVKQLKMPFAGEIPQAVQKKKTKVEGKAKDGKKKQKPAPEVLVAEKKRDVTNEAFRVMRSNLEFMLGFDSTHKLIMLTSINPGSGKTFITANLSTVIALKGKKVLAIDLDLRKGSLSEYVGSPHHGISDYLSGKASDYHGLIVPMGHVEVLPCGKLPPNPSELLYTPKFKEMLEEVREEYDYVFIDCPPAEIVADASIVGRYVDLTLFVIRAKVMERAFLPEIENWYEEKKFTNLSIILNGTEAGGGRYGYHKYGYHRYGYGYGKYGYGAYGYGVKEETADA